MKFELIFALIFNLAQNVFMNVLEEASKVVDGEQTTLLESIVPYAKKHGDILSPEQQDYVQPVLELCSQCLNEGESITVFGSHAVAACVLPHIQSSQVLHRYNSRLQQRDFDLHFSAEQVYTCFSGILAENNVEKSYPYGFKAQFNEFQMDLIDDSKVAKIYLDEIEYLCGTSKHVSTQTLNALNNLRQGDITPLHSLLSLYRPDALGVKITKKDEKLVTTLFDPLQNLDRLELNSANAEVVFTDFVNPDSALFLVITAIDNERPPAIYSTDLQSIPNVLTNAENYENVAYSAIDSLSRVAKGLLTHEVVPESPYLRDVISAMTYLARLDHEFAVNNKFIAKYVKSIQNILSQNLDKFTDCMMVLTETLPLGWCIGPDDISTNNFTKRPLTKINGIAPQNDVVTGIIDIVEHYGNPTTLEQALGMYLAAEDFGNAADSRAYYTTRLCNWWQKNYPALDSQKVLENFIKYAPVVNRSRQSPNV